MMGSLAARILLARPLSSALVAAVFALGPIADQGEAAAFRSNRFCVGGIEIPLLATAAVAFAQTDVINTEGDRDRGQPGQGFCREGIPLPGLGPPVAKFSLDNPDDLEAAREGNFARCDGQSMYCYANPEYLATGAAGENATPEEPPPDPGESSNSDGDGAEASRPPFELGAEQVRFVPGRTVDFSAADDKGIKYNLKIAVDGNGGPRNEPGVDWNKWYRDWIDTVVAKVLGPVATDYAMDRNKVRLQYEYDVKPDCTVTWGRWIFQSSNGDEHFREEILRRAKDVKAPEFPKGSNRSSVYRIFTFQHNVEAPKLRLAGPPRE